MNSIATVTLTSANMGDVTEADFDAWAAWVNERIDDVAGCPVNVEQFRFGSGNVNAVSGLDDAAWEAVQRWLSGEGWDAFCADPSAWPAD
jgi:hypothetical protein